MLKIIKVISFLSLFSALMQGSANKNRDPMTPRMESLITCLIDVYNSKHPKLSIQGVKITGSDTLLPLSTTKDRFTVPVTLVYDDASQRETPITFDCDKPLTDCIQWK